MLRLPPNIAEVSLSRFDRLVDGKEVFYSPSTPERVDHNGFLFEFRLVPALQRKPIQSHDAVGRSQATGPFVNPAKHFVIAAVGASHTLELNKYCVYRPSFILHTNQYERQSDDITAVDMSAIWMTLKAFSEPQIIIYNCGFEAGSSQGHKHFQMFPRPRSKEFALFPDEANISHGMILNTPVSLPEVPYKHFLIALPANCVATDVFSRYSQLLAKIRKIQKQFTRCPAYNVVLTVDWMVLIPRSHQGKEGITGNAATMMGMVWISSEQEREGWSRLGMTNHLAYLGIPTVADPRI